LKADCPAKFAAARVISAYASSVRLVADHDQNGRLSSNRV
jgi:hypothetical protein